MVLSRVEGTAAQAGASVRSAGSIARAIELCDAEAADLLVVDLSASTDDLAALVSQLRESRGARLRIVAFGPHVHEDRLAAAQAAGCDAVVSRGQFFSQIGAILGG